MNMRGIIGKWNAMWHSLPPCQIGDRVLGPLVGFRQQHPVGKIRVDVTAQIAQEGVGLGQILASRALALEQVRHRVEAQAVDAHTEPEIEHRAKCRALTAGLS